MKEEPDASADNDRNRRLDRMAELLDEIAEDNTAVVGAINRLLDQQEGLRADLIREVSALREDYSGSLVYRAMKDCCGELIPPLAAMESILQKADFADAATIRGHVESLALTLRNVLSRMGAEKIPISPGEEMFDPNRHKCVQLLAPASSPFPSALPRTVVRVVEDGYTLAGRVLMPAKVEVQAEAEIFDSASN
ncbi:MAG: nucleotide exchange factor GrpE [Blastocatellia bacterium]|nr:nucleotide exchange factor GrpE [Blastocatellia bacterium]